MEAGALDAALRRLDLQTLPGTMFGDLLGQLRSRPDARVRYELEHVVPACRDPSRLDPGTRRLLCALLDAIRSNVAEPSFASGPRHGARPGHAKRLRA
jgi:hypothetical protein